MQAFPSVLPMLSIQDVQPRKVLPDINVMISHYQVSQEKAMLQGKVCSSCCTTEVINTNGKGATVKRGMPKKLSSAIAF